MSALAAGPQRADALADYRRARRQAQARLRQRSDEDADGVLAALVADYHALADDCHQRGLHDSAAKLLCSVHRQLCRLIDDPACPVPWQAAAVRHARSSRHALCQALAVYGRDSRVEALLAATAACMLPRRN